MRKCENGTYRDMTAEEIAEIQSAVDTEVTEKVTIEDRLEALESAMMEVILNG